MHCILSGHMFVNEIQTITQVFYPNERFILCTEDDPPSSCVWTSSCVADEAVVSSLHDGDAYIENITSIPYGTDEKELKRFVKLSMYDVLVKKTGYIPPWGALTGIRPSKIAGQLLEDGYTVEDASRFFHEYYKTGTDKIKLAIDVAITERDILVNNDGNSISLYIGIPFCPTRCRYCSFISYPMDKYAGMIDDYLQALVKEMEHVKDFCRGRYLENIYIGGGTPTALNESRLNFLLENIALRFDVSSVKEYTAEAGRPDTLSEEKLKLLKQHNVNRISINPQTMNDKTLVRIGRAHTSHEFLNAFYAAREQGFSNINTDIIVGLEGEGPDDIADTMEKLTELGPEGITVHTLAVKRASALNEALEQTSLTGADKMEEMLRIADSCCRQMNMKPYYMYRQKNALGNFENVGYCKDGYEGIYNIQIMEERQPIIALGAGAVTKVICKGKGTGRYDRIERVFNVKNVEEYISRIDEMLRRKDEMLC